jgi:hypothetical protein
MNLAPELPSWLLGEPSHDTRRAHCIHRLAAEANSILELLERLKTCSGLRECDRHASDPYQPDAHLRAIESRDYKRALQLIAMHGRT